MYDTPKSTTFAAITTCALILALSAAGAVGAEAKLKPYTSAAGGYSVSLPAGWVIQEAPGMPMVVAINSAGAAAGFADNISAGMEDAGPGVTADAYIKNATAMMANAVQGMKEIENREIEFAGGQGRYHHFSFGMGGKQMEAAAYALVKDGKAYSLTCMAEAASFAKQKATFDAVAASFALGEAAAAAGGDEAAAEEPAPLDGAPLENPQDYTDAAKGFSIQFPEGWEISTPAKGPAVSAASPQADPRDFFREYVTVASRHIPSETTAEGLRDSSIERSRKATPNLMPVDMGTTTINGSEAAWFTYTLMMPVVGTRGVTYFIVTDGRAAVINCAAEAGAFDEFKPTFDSIAASFKFETPAGGAEGVEGVDASPAAPPANLFSDEARGFSIVFPADWTVTSKGTSSAATAVSPREGDKDTFSESLSMHVMALAKPADAKSYEATYMDSLKMRTPTLGVAESGDIKLGKNSGRYVIYTVRMGTGVFKNVAYIFARGTRAYVVTGQATDASFEKYMPVFEDVAKTLTLTDVAPPEGAKK